MVQDSECLSYQSFYGTHHIFHSKLCKCEYIQVIQKLTLTDVKIHKTIIEDWFIIPSFEFTKLAYAHWMGTEPSKTLFYH